MAVRFEGNSRVPPKKTTISSKQGAKDNSAAWKEVLDDGSTPLIRVSYRIYAEGYHLETMSAKNFDSEF